jgi:hypothetical protein
MLAAVLDPADEAKRLPALVDRAGLVVDEAGPEPDRLDGLEAEVALDLGGLLRQATQSPSASASVSRSVEKRRSSSSRLVVKRTTTSMPDFAPSFWDSGVAE